MCVCVTGLLSASVCINVNVCVWCVCVCVCVCVTGLLAVSVCSQAGVSVEVVAGDDVTLWCWHGLTQSDYLFWYKNTVSSAPELLGCKQFKLSSPPAACYFFTESSGAEMSVNSRNTSLRLTAVNHTHSGLYYCSFINNDHMIFSNTTFLHIRGKLLHRESAFCDVLFKLTLVFSAVCVILISSLIFIILKNRTINPGKILLLTYIFIMEQDDDTVNYAALNFSNKKKRRAGRSADMNIDPHIVYSSIRQ
uniref:Immunoglobulin domain-containing protein n=1 Tax=Astyanax mexicanus TaxID=7994 RepID=A0A3B1K9L5_ASTMX